jgi:trans-aconitate 2-methyltransferase
MSPAWDAQRYQGRHSYVWQFGESLIELLRPRVDERILDIGCGTGQLTAEIARSGAHVTGLDSSPDMIDQARRNYPGIPFVLADAASFSFAEPFDAVFSNAALHWVRDHNAAVGAIARALRPSGRLVAEFGGQGNIASVLAALRATLGETCDRRNPWNYPSDAEFNLLLERHGFEVLQSNLFDRPTPLEGENGMEDWLQMFCGSFLDDLSTDIRREKISELVARLGPTQYQAGVWTLDYRRLRVLAAKAR